MAPPPRTTVTTVTGDISPEELGVTLPHEHLLCDLHRITRVPDGILHDPELALREIAHFKRAGGSTLVDTTSLGLGRRPALIKSISEESGINVVMGSGWYRDPYLPPEITTRSTDDLAAEIVRDLETGVDGVRAGIIGEVGSDRDFISPAEERILRAAGRAHLATGATITTHSIRCPLGIDQLAILDHEGVEPHRVIIGHCDSHGDEDYHAAVAKAGAWVEFDLITGRSGYEVERRLRWILRLAESGYLDRLLLSSDVCNKSHLHEHGGSGYDFVVSAFAEMLRDAGFGDAEFEQLFVVNPRRALTGYP
ncbi:MAG: hypothetical protein MSC30_14740 [Gaiellaceae bacterium MAG52_C11]|nr:hypothetical protein [Candidatus Gaiellasilicea maunaloa]